MSVVFNPVDPYQMPDVVLTQAGNLAAHQKQTSNNVGFVLDTLEIRPRFNRMLRQAELHHKDFNLTDKDQLQLRVLLYDNLERCNINTRGNLDEILRGFAMDDMYHPMAEWIPKWDGVDRLGALAATVPTDNPLWPTYLRKWMIQTCEAVFGSVPGADRSLPHVLTLVSPQGRNKGRWIRALAPPMFVRSDAELHLNSSQGKDHQIQVLRYPIAELGEIDATFRKSDVSALKAFLSRTVDEIREPYARAAVAHPRGTCFIGTVNNAAFLNDTTGTRRFWPIVVDGVLVWDHGIDMAQAWAQAAHYWESGEDWVLDDADEREREHQAVDTFSAVSPIADLLETHHDKYREDWGSYILANKTAILEACGIKSPSPVQAHEAGMWLEHNLGPHRKLGGVRRCWAWPAGSQAVLRYQGKFLSARQAKEYVMAQKGNK